MHSFGKDFDALNSVDIQNLITNQVSEMRSLDYKQTLPDGSNDGKKEFLADVSSLANSGGGHIFYGIKEQRGADGKGTGFPEAAEGIAGLNADPEILRLESLLRDGVEPRIQSVRCRAITEFTNGPVLAIEVGPSWISPHMVTFQNSSRFFARGSNGKFQLDVQQIRSAVLAGDSLSKKLRDFRADRIAKISAGEESMDRKKVLILHLIPFAAFSTQTDISIAQMKARTTELAPISSYSYTNRVNIEGYRVYWDSTNQGTTQSSYAQAYRNGIIEAVDAAILHNDDLVPTIALEQKLNGALGRYLKFQRDSGVTTPIALMLSFIGVKGLKLAVYNQQFWIPGHSSTPIDRDLLVLPEHLITDYLTRPDHLLRPVYNAFYNAAGWDDCPHYDTNGNWVNDGR